MIPVAGVYDVAKQFVLALRGITGKCQFSSTLFVMSEDIPGYFADADHEYKARQQHQPFT